MRRPSLSTLYLYGILAVLFGMVLHAPLSVYFGTLWPGLADPIKAWKEIALTLLALPAIILLTRHNLWKRFWSDWLVRLSFGYIALHVLLAVFLPGELKTTVAGLMIDLRFIAFFMLAYVLTVLRPDALGALLRTAVAGIVVVLGFGLLQITILPDDILTNLGYGSDTIRPFTTIDRNPDFVRINSTLRGPNPLGAFCMFAGSLAGAYLIVRWRQLTKHRRNQAILAVAAAAVVLFASYSRSAYAAAILAIIILMASQVKRLLSARIMIGMASAVVVSVGAFWFLQTTDWYSNVVLHEDPESTVVAKSNQEHLNSLADGLDRVMGQPLGAGVGSTGSASLYDEQADNDAIIENWYLFVAHESGWLGLALFMVLNVLVLERLWRRRTDWRALGLFASGIGLMTIGLLLPVWADETVALTWWGLVGGILGNGYAKRTR